MYMHRSYVRHQLYDMRIIQLHCSCTCTCIRLNATSYSYRQTSGSFSPKVEEGLSLGEGVSDVEISRNACTPVERESVLCGESATSDEPGGQKGFNII